MKVLKRIGFSVLNLILTFFYFGILVLVLFFSVAPDHYGSQDSFLLEDQYLEIVLIPVFLLTMGITQYLTFRIKPDKILEALYVMYLCKLCFPLTKKPGMNYGKKNDNARVFQKNYCFSLY